MMPSNSNKILLKKLDSILEKVEEVSSATRRSLDDLKGEVRNRYDEIQQRVDVIENKMKTMETKREDISMQMFPIMQNICTSLLDPQGSQSAQWKSYWQEQIKLLEELRSLFTKSTQ